MLTFLIITSLCVLIYYTIKKNYKKKEQRKKEGIEGYFNEYIWGTRNSINSYLKNLGYTDIDNELFNKTLEDLVNRKILLHRRYISEREVESWRLNKPDFHHQKTYYGDRLDAIVLEYFIKFKFGSSQDLLEYSKLKECNYDRYSVSESLRILFNRGWLHKINRNQYQSTVNATHQRWNIEKEVDDFFEYLSMYKVSTFSDIKKYYSDMNKSITESKLLEIMNRIELTHVLFHAERDLWFSHPFMVYDNTQWSYDKVMNIALSYFDNNPMGKIEDIMSYLARKSVTANANSISNFIDKIAEYDIYLERIDQGFWRSKDKSGSLNKIEQEIVLLDDQDT